MELTRRTLVNMNVYSSDCEVLFISFLKEHGLSNIDISPFNQGGNNKAYKISCSEGEYILKSYFTSHNDNRARLLAEFSFSQFCWENKIRCMPQPFFASYENNFSVYEYIQGEKIKKEKIEYNHIEQCVKFVKSINKLRSSEEAKKLSNASESCFSLQEHLKVVEKRVTRLETIEEDCFVDSSAKEFVNNNLFPLWKKVKNKFILSCDEEEPNIDALISENDRILSPSDFGFHNALCVQANLAATNQSVIKFIDFEYAGWDDPSKLICDFFNQVEIPISFDFFSYFSEEIFSLTDNPKYHRKRTELLMPLYKIKWICIILNNFLPQNRDRQKFLGTDISIHKENQLKKAKILFQQF